MTCNSPVFFESSSVLTNNRDKYATHDDLTAIYPIDDSYVRLNTAIDQGIEDFSSFPIVDDLDYEYDDDLDYIYPPDPLYHDRDPLLPYDYEEKMDWEYSDEIPIDESPISQNSLDIGDLLSGHATKQDDDNLPVWFDNSLVLYLKCVALVFVFPFIWLYYFSLALVASFAKSRKQDVADPIIEGGPEGPSGSNVSAESHTSITSQREVSSETIDAASNDKSFINDYIIELPSWFNQYIPFFRMSGHDSNFVHSIPSSIFSLTTRNPITALFQQCAFVVWDSVDIYVTCSAPPNVSGLFIMAATVPSINDTEFESTKWADFVKSKTSASTARLFNSPHVKITPTQSNSAILNVPWCSPFAAVSTTTSWLNCTSVFNLHFRTLVAASAGVGNSASCSFTGFIKFNGLKGFGKKPTNVEATLEPFQWVAQKQDRDLNIIHKYTDLCNEGLSPCFVYESHGPKERLVWKCCASIGSKVFISNAYCNKKDAKYDCIVQIVHKLSKKQDFTKILKGVKSGLSSLAGKTASSLVDEVFSFVCDAPTLPSRVDFSQMPLNVDGVARGVGPRKEVVLDIGDDVHESKMEGLSYPANPGYDDMYREGILGTLPIPTSTPANTIIAHRLISPIDGINEGELFTPTPSAAVLSHYQYSNLVLEILVFVVKSVMQTVTLNFALNPCRPAVSVDDALSGRNETVTFKENTVFAFEVPYIGTTRNFDMSPPYVNKQYTSSNSDNVVPAFAYLTISLVNQITSNNLCADHISLVVSQRVKVGTAPSMYCPRSTILRGLACPPVVSTAAPTKQDEEVKPLEPMVGSEVAKPAVNTATVDLVSDGFGQIARPLDVARRFSHYGVWRGDLSSTATVRKILNIPITYVPSIMETQTDFVGDSFNYSMRDTLCDMYQLAGGALSMLLSILGSRDCIVKVYYVNGTPFMQNVANGGHEALTIDQIVRPTVLSVPVDASEYSSEYIALVQGLRAFEVRSLNTNNQLLLNLPCHNQFSSMFTHPIDNTLQVFDDNNFLYQSQNYYKYVRSAVLGNLLVEIDGPAKDIKIDMQMRFSDTTSVSFPIGPSTRKFRPGNNFGINYAINVNEPIVPTIASTAKDILLYAQYHGRFFGGIQENRMYPLRPAPPPPPKPVPSLAQFLEASHLARHESSRLTSHEISMFRDRSHMIPPPRHVDDSHLLLLAGDVEENPGPVQSKPDFKRSRLTVGNSLRNGLSHGRSVGVGSVQSGLDFFRNSFTVSQVNETAREVSGLIQQVEPRIEDILTGTEAAVNNIADAAAGVERTTSVMEGCADAISSFMTSVYNKFKVAGRFISLTLENFLRIAHHFVNMWLAQKYSVTLSCLFGIFVELGFISMRAMLQYLPKVSELFTMFVKQDEEADESVCLRFANIILMMLMGTVGLAFVPLKELPKKMLQTVKDVFMSANAVNTFIKFNMDLIKLCLSWIVGRFARAELLCVTTNENREKLGRWLANVLKCLDPSNDDQLKKNKAFQNLFCDTYSDTADLLSEYSLALKEKDCPANVVKMYNMISVNFNRMQKRFTEFAKFMISCDRYSVPFCMWIYGPPGVGKSHIVPYITKLVLKKMNVPVEKGTDPIYRREVGQEFWDGLSGEPILWMCDPEQCTSEKEITTLIKDYFSVFSPTVFIPNMASLEDKGRVHKFMGAFIDSNEFCADKKQLLLNKEAFLGRRDVVMKLLVNPKFEQHCAKFGLDLKGRGAIEAYCEAVAAGSCDPFPGFDEYSHLLAAVSYDGREHPVMNSNSPTTFQDVIGEVVERLAAIVKRRKISSKRKEKMFEDLAPEAVLSRMTEDVDDDVMCILGQPEKQDGDSTEEEEEEFVDSSSPCVHKDVAWFADQGVVFSTHDDQLTFAYPKALLLKGEPGFEWDAYGEDHLIVPRAAEQCTCSKDFVDELRQTISNHSTLSQEELDKVFPTQSFLYKNIPYTEISISSVLKKCAYLFGLAGIGYLLFKICSGLYHAVFTGEKNEYDRGGVVNPKAKPAASMPDKVEIAHKNDYTEALSKGCGKVVLTRIDDGELKSSTLHCYSLGGTLWMTSGHFLRRIDAESPFNKGRPIKFVSCELTYITTNGDVCQKIVSPDQFKYAYTCDFYDVGVFSHILFPLMKKKISFIATRAEMTRSSNTGFVMRRDFSVKNEKGSTNCFTKDVEYNFGMQTDSDDETFGVFVYPGYTGNGFCGSVLVNTKIGKIVGMHSTGWFRHGGASPICTELINQLCATIDIEFTDTNIIKTSSSASDLSNLQTCIEGIDDPTFRGRIATKTSIIKSEFHGALGEPNKFPPKPTKEDCTKAMDPYRKPPKVMVIDTDVLNSAIKDYEELALRNMKPVSAYQVRPLSIKEALEGTGEDFMIPPMRSTSCGVPLVNQGLPNKGACIREHMEGSRRVVDGLDKRFIERYNEVVSDLRSGRKPNAPHMLFLKDEIKKEGKNIRGINGCDFVLHVLYLQYFLPFFASFRKTRFGVGSSIGIDIAREATDLFNYMSEVQGSVPLKERKFLTADYSNFGPTIIHHVASRLIDVVVSWARTNMDVTDEDIIMMRRLWAILTQAEHVVLDQLWTCSQGIFSGNPFTDCINTMVNNIYVRCAFIGVCSKYAPYLCAKEENLYNMRNFNLKVRMAAYGDDLVIAVDEDLIHIFNNVTLQEFIQEEFGLTMTDALKRPTMVPYDVFRDVSFLKHTFEIHPTRKTVLLAKLDEQTIINMVCYVKGRDNYLGRHEQIAADAVRFMHAHGQPAFLRVRRKLQDCLRSMGSSVILESWPEIDYALFAE